LGRNNCVSLLIDDSIAPAAVAASTVVQTPYMLTPRALLFEVYDVRVDVYLDDKLVSASSSLLGEEMASLILSLSLSLSLSFFLFLLIRLSTAKAKRALLLFILHRSKDRDARAAPVCACRLTLRMQLSRTPAADVLMFSNANMTRPQYIAYKVRSRSKRRVRVQRARATATDDFRSALVDV
jgi:hypothetical protein